MNEFVKANILGANTLTENGALSYSTIGSTLLDQFAKAGTARGRDINEVWNEQSQLWAEDADNALKFPFYLRMITRKVNIDGELTNKVQRGQGARDEAFKRLLWIEKYHPEEFYRNLWILPLVGSWRDLWVLLVEGNVSDKNAFFNVIADGINNKSACDLVKKYMPRIRSSRNEGNTKWAKKTNELAKEFAKYVGWTYSEYRYFKSTGKAHKFQKDICSGNYSNIDWKTIPGKALLSLVSGKFLGNHNLEESYIKWLEKQPVAKFNGYPFELGMKLGQYGQWKNLSRSKLMTINKQFDGLIKTASEDDGAIKGNVLCAIDTSGSMGCQISGGPSGLTSYDVCVSLGIYFSELNTGAFHNTIAMFDNKSWLMTLEGNFSDKWTKIINSTTAWGSTNFQSLIDLLIKTKLSRPDIPESEFPQTLLVVSDMQFNPTRGSQSNADEMIGKLRNAFSKEFVDNFKVVWWYCASRDGSSHDFPSTIEHGGMYNISGFDGSVISFILGGEEKAPQEEKAQPTMEDIIRDAFSQEVLSLVK